MAPSNLPGQLIIIYEVAVAVAFPWPLRDGKYSIASDGIYRGWIFFPCTEPDIFFEIVAKKTEKESRAARFFRGARQEQGVLRSSIQLQPHPGVSTSLPQQSPAELVRVAQFLKDYIHIRFITYSRRTSQSPGVHVANDHSLAQGPYGHSGA
ncbi:hypothetical protein DL98DRAFT_524300 [Cadophora sp. DSE1049]|nr:hypothetical protein DL98DRAFT_524300 [Cadophora sp. DSE1049]